MVGLTFIPAPSETESKIIEQVSLFTKIYLQPNQLEDDLKGVFRRGQFDAFAKMGLHALSIPKENGGKGLPYGCYYACMEQLAFGSLSFAITVGVTNLLQGALLTKGSKYQKEKYLFPLAKGTQLGAYSLSEPGSGSDAAALITTATKKGDGYLLNGTKCWCSSAGEADLYLVMARTHPDRNRGITAFVLEKNTPGLTFGKLEKKLGLATSPLGELIFEDCFVPQSQRIGEEGEGFKIALKQLDAGRIVIGVSGIGVARRALEKVWEFYQEEPNSRLLESYRPVLAECFAEIQAVKSLIKHASVIRDNQQDIRVIAPQIKLLGSNLAVRATNEALCAIGSYGQSKDYELERLFRDAKALQIVEGTNQIQKMVLGRHMDEMMRRV